MGNEQKQVITRPHDQAWTVGSMQKRVEIHASKARPSPVPFYTLPPDIKPAEAAAAVMEAYRTNPEVAGKIGYVHCVRLDTQTELISASLQMFNTDVWLGNLKKDGFLRQMIDPSLSDDENLQHLKKAIKELRRYQRDDVLAIHGFYTAQEEPKQ